MRKISKKNKKDYYTYVIIYKKFKNNINLINFNCLKHIIRS